MTGAELAFVILGWGVFPVVLAFVGLPDRIRRRWPMRGIRRGACRDAVVRRCARFGVRVQEFGSQRLRLSSTASMGFVSITGAFADVAFDVYDRVLYVD
ncbi:MAG: hypothetical protein JWM87_4201 [Candidatus Eremiobacteraeota bacterium]|nr:hypothetical protein [Candidatus Eremiobacteraeota bacterium]